MNLFLLMGKRARMGESICPPEWRYYWLDRGVDGSNEVRCANCSLCDPSNWDNLVPHLKVPHLHLRGNSRQKQMLSRLRNKKIQAQPLYPRRVTPRHLYQPKHRNQPTLHILPIRHHQPTLHNLHLHHCPPIRHYQPIRPCLLPLRYLLPRLLEQKASWKLYWTNLQSSVKTKLAYRQKSTVILRFIVQGEPPRTRCATVGGKWLGFMRTQQNS